MPGAASERQAVTAGVALVEGEEMVGEGGATVDAAVEAVQLMQAAEGTGVGEAVVGEGGSRVCVGGPDGESVIACFCTKRIKNTWLMIA